MADYYPLIARAVAGLDKNTGEARRALYDRARSALVAQLRGIDPPLEETEVTRERLALEESIRKVEAEAARRARTEAAAASRRGGATAAPAGQQFHAATAGPAPAISTALAPGDGAVPCAAAARAAAIRTAASRAAAFAGAAVRPGTDHAAATAR